MVVLSNSEQEENSEAVQTILRSLDNPQTAGLILEEQANALKTILGDASVLKLVRAHDKLEEGRKQVETQDTVQLAKEVRFLLEYGMTLGVENGDLVVARIIHGGMIDRQGLLHVGDKIKEVNGKDMSGNPNELQDLLRDSTGKIFLKVIPSNVEAPAPSQVRMQFTEYTRNIRNILFPQDFDKHEMLVYEEVARMPPFHRKTLVLVGAQGVGRRTLKNRLMLSDRSRFGTTIPHTSRVPREDEQSGKNYHFTTRQEMEQDIRAGMYLENGDFEGNLYGTKVDSIREVMRSGKMCILDVNPTALKILKNPEFMPFVVFIAAPSLDDIKVRYKNAQADGNIIRKRTVSINTT
ncbi:PREDICTED: MAGUK p55 subfamily member 2-like [Acropora digitifera]|uniref:MAGUK p55 subfamily member 2-like n=1 Tax=Acropora digitifera TaxID=70779 RepID=UPI00077AAFF5|nr:PREDICTED: MAGUK p55 subfamily member 2-like [Acropora digitifera]